MSGPDDTDRGAAPGAAFEDLLARTFEGDGDESEIDIVAVPLASPIARGDVLKDRYRVDKVLARGGIGIVVRATDTKLDRTVAIKLLLPHFANQQKARDRFDLEAKVAAKIDSEHVTRVLDVGELDDGAQFLVMEHLTGEELGHHIEGRGKLPVEDAVELLLQVCRVVALAHAAGILHRDLKPSNVFVTHRADGSPCVKVLDFGVAKMFLGGAQGATGASSLVGTPRYMAPEQIAHKGVDERVDIWALGAILFEMVTGKPPFHAPRVPDLFDRITNQPPASLRALLPSAPAALEAVIDRCLQKEPSKRFASAAELATALTKLDPAPTSRHAERAMRALARTESGSSAPPRAEERPEPPKQGAAAWAPVAGVAGVLAVATIAWLGLRSPPSPPPAVASASAAAPASASSSAGPAGAETLKVGFVYVGVPQDEGWTGAHDRGRREAASRLPWLETDFVSNAHDPKAAEAAIDGFVARGFNVIIANSFSLRDTVAKKAKEHPSTKFLIYSYPPSPEVGAFGGRLEQAWYLAGFAAADRTRSKRLGFVGSLVTPEVVRYINAFTRGARRRDPGVVVEVRWLGFWFDTEPADDRGRHKEERLADELLASGCDVIAHNADNGRVVEAVEARGNGALSIATNDPRGCDKGPKSCLGSVAWNWAPIYASMLSDVHAGAWTPSSRYHPGIRANAELSAVNFVINPAVGGSKLALEVAPVLAELESDATGTLPFRGPYCSTGQRATCVETGATPSEAELRTMCFYVEGVVDKVDPTSPTSMDRPAKVPEPTCSEQQ